MVMKRYEQKLTSLEDDLRVARELLYPVCVQMLLKEAANDPNKRQLILRNARKGLYDGK